MDQSKPPEREEAEAVELRRLAYARVFSGQGHRGDIEMVFFDLARFCRAHESTFDPNTHSAARLDGRREVWLRIQEQAGLDPETLFKLYMMRKVKHVR